MSDEYLEKVQYVLLVFEDKTQWYLRWLKKDFRHVSAILMTEERGVLLTAHFGSVKAVLLKKYPDIIENELVSVKVKPRFVHKGIGFLVTCVQLAKNQIGLRNWFIVTPYQLYKEVVKDEWKSVY